VSIPDRLREIEESLLHPDLSSPDRW